MCSLVETRQGCSATKLKTDVAISPDDRKTSELVTARQETRGVGIIGFARVRIVHTKKGQCERRDARQKGASHRSSVKSIPLALSHRLGFPSPAQARFRGRCDVAIGFACRRFAAADRAAPPAIFPPEGIADNGDDVGARGA